MILGRFSTLLYTKKNQFVLYIICWVRFLSQKKLFYYFLKCYHFNLKKQSEHARLQLTKKKKST